MNPYPYALAVLAVATCQGVCAQAATATNPSAETSRPAESRTPDASVDKTPTLQPRVMRGNDRVIAPAVTLPALSGASSAFNFEETPVADVVRIVLGDILKADYVLHPPLVGTVTLSTREAVSPDQAVYLLESALQANGLALVRDVRGTYHVGRPEALKAVGSSMRQVLKGSALPPGYGAIIVPLQFIGANEMATILRPLVPTEALVRVDTVRNLLVMVGTRSQADGWLDMVRTFDVDLLKGMSVGVFPLKYASVKEVEAALRLMSSGGAAATAAGGTALNTTTNARSQVGATTGSAAGSAVSLGEANPLHGAIRIMPIERLSSILVVTPRATYLEEVGRWIERFDKPSDNTAEPQLFVYAVQNGSAKHLADVLNSIFGGGTASGSAGSPGAGVAPRLNPVTSTGPGAAAATATATQSANRAPAAPVSAVILNQGVRVVADDRNNALLIYGTRVEYSRIEAALKRLDVPPTQVLIEASIIEVTLTDELSYGVQWMFNDNARNGLQGAGVISGQDRGVLGPALAGFSYALKNPLGNVRAVLNAIAEKTKLNVIASPSLMVLDNHTANISSGTQQPINIGSTIGQNGAITANIQYRDTGVILAVTPSANAGDMVTMDISQSVTDVGPTDTSGFTGTTGQPTFLQRQVTSKVAVRSGETIVLGGLIQEKLTSSSSGAPGLQDIPLIGALFGTKSKNVNRTELLVVITPRVVRSDQAVRDLSQELRERMRGIAGGSQDRRSLGSSKSPTAQPTPTQEN